MLYNVKQQPKPNISMFQTFNLTGGITQHELSERERVRTKYLGDEKQNS